MWPTKIYRDFKEMSYLDKLKILNKFQNIP